MRDRARALGLSDAEVARRSGLAERRYGNYVTGRREPDLATLLRIAEVLATTPDRLLGVDRPSEGEQNGRAAVLAELFSVLEALSDDDLRLATRQARAVLEHRRALMAGG